MSFHFQTKTKKILTFKTVSHISFLWAMKFESRREQKRVQMLTKNTFHCTTEESPTLMLSLNILSKIKWFFCMKTPWSTWKNAIPVLSHKPVWVLQLCSPNGFLAFSSERRGRYAALDSLCLGDKQFWRERQVFYTYSFYCPGSGDMESLDVSLPAGAAAQATGNSSHRTLYNSLHCCDGLNF